MNSKTSEYQFVISDTKEIVSQVSYVNPEKPNIYFWTDTGHIKFNDYHSAGSKNVRKVGEKVTFLIVAKGFRARYIEILIKPTYSTFIEVNLTRR